MEMTPKEKRLARVRAALVSNFSLADAVVEHLEAELAELAPIVDLFPFPPSRVALG